MSQHLEERVAHLMRTVEELSDVVALQQGQIDRLSATVDYLRQRAAEAEAQATGGIILGDERPPHY